MVSKRPKGLGLGLEALLGPKVSDKELGAGGEPVSVAAERLMPGRFQPRTRVDAASLASLADSIKAQGVMQPVLVRPAGQGRYEIIAGERRWRAAQMAGLDQVPIVVKEVGDEAAAVMALIENIQREDLNPLEEAHGLQRLVTDFGFTHERAAQAVGRSRSAATNLLRLLSLAEPVQQMLLQGQLDMGHARALLALAAGDQVMAAKRIAARGLSVREAEKLVAEAAGARRGAASKGGAKRTKPRDIVRLEEQLADALGAKVEIRLRRGDKGELSIAFGSLDELNGLLERLGVTET
jgi:ParB family chromosome partitioning protein